MGGMDDMHALMREMRDFAARAGISVATLSTRAAGDGKFYGRLEAGAEALPRTVRKVREWMRVNEHMARTSARRDRSVKAGDAA